LSRVSVPKHKIDRRLGVNLYGNVKSPFNTRQSGAGQHGKSIKRKKKSDYRVQLEEKQKLRFYYGMKEKQFRIFFAKAMRSRGNVAEAFIAMLESRLDAFVYRMKWASSIFAAKQMIKHKHIMVNGKVVSISSYLVKPNDEVKLSAAMKDHAIIEQALAQPTREFPSYYSIDDNKKSAKLIKLPVLTEIPYPIKINPHLIVEYYSRRM
jgi:small subunit ribosomal protein S4